MKGQSFMRVKSKLKLISPSSTFGKEVPYDSCHIHTGVISVAGIVVNKRDAALNPEMIDALIFLNKNNFFLMVYHRVLIQTKM